MRHLAPLALVAGAALAVAPTRVQADPRVLGRVLTAPTAWLPDAGTVVASASVDHRVDGAASVTVGLRGLAALEVGTDTDVRSCVACDGDEAAAWLGRAAFRMGARQDAWFRGMPALVLGMRTTFAGGRRRETRVSKAHVVASRALGPVRVHAGATLTAAGYEDAGGVTPVLAPTLRPLLGFEWTPPIYPRTSLLADLAWVARLDDAAVGGPRLEWLAGWGVRYQALRWASIELSVRHRQDEELGASTVLIRVNGVIAKMR